LYNLCTILLCNFFFLLLWPMLCLLLLTLFSFFFLDLSAYALSSSSSCLGFALGCTAAVIIFAGTLEINTYVYFTSRVPFFALYPFLFIQKMNRHLPSACQFFLTAFQLNDTDQKPVSLSRWKRERLARAPMAALSHRVSDKWDLAHAHSAWTVRFRGKVSRLRYLSYYTRPI
jgi:hypothetical protein